MLTLSRGYLDKTILLFLSPDRVHQEPTLLGTDSMMSFADSGEQARADRLTEIGGLLAQALMRLQSRKSSAIRGEFGESSLHFTPDQSGDAEPCSAEVSR